MCYENTWGSGPAQLLTCCGILGIFFTSLILRLLTGSPQAFLSLQLDSMRQLAMKYQMRFVVELCLGGAVSSLPTSASLSLAA